MGRYINWDDVVGRYPRIGDIGGSNMVGSAYIVYAEAEIDGRLTSHTSPFSSNNLTIKDLCIDLTYAKAISPANDEKAKEIRGILDERIERLNNNQESMITDSGDSLSGDIGIAWSETENYNTTFNADDAINYEVDSSKLYDIEQDRL